MKNILIITIFIISINIVWALEPVSYRIKSLGSDLQGIVKDEYTDLLANPARIVQTDDKRIYGKIGYSAKPFTLGFTVKKFGLVTEGSESLNRTEDLSRYQEYYSGIPAWYISDNLSKRKNQSESIDVYLVKGFSLKNKSLGIALFGQRNLAVDNYCNEYSHFYKSSGNQIIYQSKDEREEKNETDTQTLRLLLGYHYQGKQEKEHDFVFTLSLTEKRDLDLQRYYNFRDNDPDNNGKTYDGNDIPTPNYHWTLNEIKTESVLQPGYGAGIEYRLRKKINENIKSGFLVGMAGQFKKLKVKETRTNQTYEVTGTTVSTGGSQSITPSPKDTGAGNIFVSLGRSIKIKDRFLISYGLRTDFSYDGETYVLTGRLVFPLGVEYEILPVLIFRSGVSVIFSGTGKSVSVTHPDGTESQLFTLTFDQTASYSAGFGLKPSEQWVFDFFTTGDVFNISSWQLQARYLF